MILVTGGLGFIGSAYIWWLNQQGVTDITIYDRFRNDDKWLNIRNLQFKEIILSDQDLDRVEKSSFKLIVHLGACSSTTEQDMDFLYRNNFELSKKLWYLAAGEQIPFIYASSAATYGSGEHGFDDQTDINKLKPLNKYGYSKQLFDQWVLRQMKDGDFITPPLFAGLKFFNVFGPNEYHKNEMASVVYKTYHQIQKTGEMKLFKSYRDDYADGEQRRDFVYIKDVCEMIDHFRTHPDAPSGLYNLGCGKAHSFRELTEAVFKALNLPVKIDFIEMPESIRDQYQYFTEAKMEKLSLNQNCLCLGDDYLDNRVKDYVQNYLVKENPFLQV